jgi:cytochrome c peroxidase
MTMTPQRFLVLLAALLIAWVLPSLTVRAHDPHVCPENYPDTPTLAGHVEQWQITDGLIGFDEIVGIGEDLFVSVVNSCDGQGRPATTGTGNKRAHGQPDFIRTSAPDSNACAGCHAQPRAGGGGDFVANVFVLAHDQDPVTDRVSAEFSNERNTLGMFGSGAIEMLAREMTADLQAICEAAIEAATESGAAVTRSLDTKGVNFGSITAFPDGTVDTGGVLGVDADLIVRPFHQAGVVVSLREFTVNAFNHHHGLQAEERFDLDPAKAFDSDYDEDGVHRELTIGDITAATIFQAALGTPGRIVPSRAEERQAVELGERLFAQVGCASCHVPRMTLESSDFVEPNPWNPAGTFSDTAQSYRFDLTVLGELPRLEASAEGGAVVWAYTDLKRHDLCDDETGFYCNEQLAQGRPDQGDTPGQAFFLTRKLWDVGSSAPYGHRGDLTTITDAILYHGGEARAARDAFVALDVEDQAAIVGFLKTLRILPAGCADLIVDEDHTCLKASR